MIVFYISSAAVNRLRYSFFERIFVDVYADLFFRLCRKRYLAQVETRSDKDYIYERVNYYNKMRHPVALPDKTFHEHKFGYYIFLDKIRKFRPSTFHKVYYFDLQDVLRWFSQKLRIGYIPGDVYFTPEFPAIVKSRLLKTTMNIQFFLNWTNYAILCL